MKKVKFAGNKHTNKSSRRGFKPIIIVDHISQGTISSLINWFTSPNNKVSSAHYGVSRKGDIYQFVDIKKNAWGNGIKLKNIKNSTSDLVKSKYVNPNWYSISIEHEGVYEQTKGKLTEEQKEATIWLHKHIQQEVKRIYGHEIKLDREHILGHYEIDPVRKPFCPGELFPFDEIIAELNKDQVPSWAKEAWEWAKANKINDGKVDSEEEIRTMCYLYRYHKKFGGR